MKTSISIIPTSNNLIKKTIVNNSVMFVRKAFNVVFEEELLIILSTQTNFICSRCKLFTIVGSHEKKSARSIHLLFKMSERFVGEKFLSFFFVSFFLLFFSSSIKMVFFCSVVSIYLYNKYLNLARSTERYIKGKFALVSIFVRFLLLFLFYWAIMEYTLDMRNQKLYSVDKEPDVLSLKMFSYSCCCKLVNSMGILKKTKCSLGSVFLWKCDTILL